MARRTRAEMEETRALLISSARKTFGERGYAETSMDDLTAQAGLTRGALYHHFGDKQGLLGAVAAQIDGEMDARLQSISNNAVDAWEGFAGRCHAYLEMAQEPEIQRIVLLDAPSVLGNSGDSQQQCIASLQGLLEVLIDSGVVRKIDPHALSAMIQGSLTEAAFWIAREEGGVGRLDQAKAVLGTLLEGIRSSSQQRS